MHPVRPMVHGVLQGVSDPKPLLLNAIRHRCTPGPECQNTAGCARSDPPRRALFGRSVLRGGLALAGVALRIGTVNNYHYYAWQSQSLE